MEKLCTYPCPNLFIILLRKWTKRLVVPPHTNEIMKRFGHGYFPILGNANLKVFCIDVFPDFKLIGRLSDLILVDCKKKTFFLGCTG